jgi:hypothetical protein
VPLATARRSHATVIQRRGDGAQRGRARRLYLADGAHIEADGVAVFAAAGRMGLEVIVSKRRRAPYQSAGRVTGSRPRTRMVRL